MALRPYVAITGLTAPEQAGLLHVPEYEDRDVVLGVLVSYKTIEDRPRSPRYPELETARAIVEAIRGLGRRDVIPAVHYNTSGQTARDIGVIVRELLGEEQRALVQLNMGNAEDVERAWLCDAWARAKARNAIAPIFQMNRSIRAKLGEDEALRFFEGLLFPNSTARLLLDMSGGRGKEMDPQDSLRLGQRARELCPRLVPGFAGGLDPENVSGVLSILGNVSIDVETGVRDDQDRFSVPKANAFLGAVASALSRRK